MWDSLADHGSARQVLHGCVGTRRDNVNKRRRAFLVDELAIGEEAGQGLATGECMRVAENVSEVVEIVWWAADDGGRQCFVHTRDSEGAGRGMVHHFCDERVCWMLDFEDKMREQSLK